MDPISQPHNTGTVSGTAGGTLLVLLTQINKADLINTCVMAGVGAMVSYLVSLGMKWLIGRVSNRMKLQQEKRREKR